MTFFFKFANFHEKKLRIPVFEEVMSVYVSDFGAMMKGAHAFREDFSVPEFGHPALGQFFSDLNAKRLGLQFVEGVYRLVFHADR